MLGARNDAEKANAFQGLCLLIQANPQTMQDATNFFWLLRSVPSTARATGSRASLSAFNSDGILIEKRLWLPSSSSVALAWPTKKLLCMELKEFHWLGIHWHNARRTQT